MPAVCRSRTLPATPDELWAIVADAHHLPRWWPRVTRVEGVEADAFTQVLTTGGGATVRADFEIVASERPRRLRWRQTVANTPFERVFVSSEVELRLEPVAGGGTRVELETDQQLRGTALLGGFIVRRAGRRQLDAALGGLAALVGG